MKKKDKEKGENNLFHNLKLYFRSLSLQNVLGSLGK